MNYRMTDIQAALGISQVKRLGRIIEERTKIKRYIDKSFKAAKYQLSCWIFLNVNSALHLCVIQLLDLGDEMHEKLFMYLRDNNIGVQIHYSPIHLQPYYKKLGFKEGDFPNSELYEKNAYLYLFSLVLKQVSRPKLWKYWKHS